LSLRHPVRMNDVDVCMYTCAKVYTYICMRVRTFVRMFVRIFVSVPVSYVSMCACIQYTHTAFFLHTSVVPCYTLIFEARYLSVNGGWTRFLLHSIPCMYACIFVCVCVCLYFCMRVCIYVCMCA